MRGDQRIIPSSPLLEPLETSRTRAARKLVEIQQHFSRVEDVDPNQMDQRIALMKIEEIWIRYGLNMITKEQRNQEMRNLFEKLKPEVMMFLETGIPDSEFTPLELVRKGVENPVNGEIHFKGY